VQEAFIQILTSDHVPVVAPRGGGEAMVRRNTQWAAFKLFARARASSAREQRYAAVAGVDEDHAWVRIESHELVNTICATLSQAHREVLFLRYVQGHSDVAAAAMLGISTKAFRSRCRRALEEARRTVESR